MGTNICYTVCSESEKVMFGKSRSYYEIELIERNLTVWTHFKTSL